MLVQLINFLLHKVATICFFKSFIVKAVNVFTVSKGERFTVWVGTTMREKTLYNFLVCHIRIINQSGRLLK